MTPRNSKECKEYLKFLDYLRKSKCTPTNLPYRSSYQELESNILCQKTLDDMYNLTNKCLELKYNEIKYKR